MIQHRHTTPRNPSRVVVLGGSGFLGTYLLRRLAAAGIRAVGTSSREVDLCHTDSIARLAGMLQPDDAVVFASALTPDKGRDSDALMRNLSMAHHVGKALKDKPVAHLIYISSDAVYADDVDLTYETARCEPSSLYGLMHLTREKMMQESCAAKNIPLMVVRPTLMYGLGDTHNSYGPNRFNATARRDGKITLFGGGEEKRDHVHIDDAARLVELCLTQGTTGLLNLATGVSTSFGDIAEMVAQRIGNVTIEKLPRKTPITHRHFDTTNLLRAFPQLRFCGWDAGLEYVSATRAAAA